MSSNPCLSPAPLASSEVAARRRLSQLLTELAEDASRERVSVGDLLAVMKDRAIGTLLFVFALPNVFPTPPGTSSLLAAPLLFLAVQLAFGLAPWLPRIVAGRSISRTDFAALNRRARPWLLRVERFLRPRLALLSSKPAEQLVGLVCFVLALILVLPIPLGNMVPAIAICLLALGILERDGAWILAGLGVALVSVVLVGVVLYGMAQAAEALWGSLT